MPPGDDIPAQEPITKPALALRFDLGEPYVSFPRLVFLDEKRLPLLRRADECVTAEAVEELSRVLRFQDLLEPRIDLVDDRLGRLRRDMHGPPRHKVHSQHTGLPHRGDVRHSLQRRAGAVGENTYPALALLRQRKYRVNGRIVDAPAGHVIERSRGVL